MYCLVERDNALQMTKRLEEALRIAASIVSEGSSVASIGIDSDRAKTGAHRGILTTPRGTRHRAIFVPVRGSLGLAGINRILQKASPTKASPVVVLKLQAGAGEGWTRDWVVGAHLGRYTALRPATP